MIIEIPFSGFYESWYSDELDDVEKNEVEYYCEEHDVDEEWLANEMWRFQDIRKAEQVICPVYVDTFNDFIAETFNLQLGLTFSDMSSPKEYNFTTDRIFAHISDDAVQALFDAVDTPALRKTIRDRFTSRDGFISFYSNNLENWLEQPLSEWDHNELGTLFYALIADEEEFEANLFLRMCEGDTFYNAFQESIDWPKLEQAVTEHKLEELGESEPNAFIYPLGISDPEHYVKVFCETNHFKE